jgi:hypothetical protein
MRVKSNQPASAATASAPIKLIRAMAFALFGKIWLIGGDERRP